MKYRGQPFEQRHPELDITPYNVTKSGMKMLVRCMVRELAGIELLDEKGLIGTTEILERVKRLQAQTQSRKKPHY